MHSRCTCAYMHVREHWYTVTLARLTSPHVIHKLEIWREAYVHVHIYSRCILTYMYMLAMTHYPLQHATSVSVGVLVIFFITDSTRHYHKCVLFCDLEGSRCICSYTATYSMSTCTNVHISNMTHHPLQQASSISVGVLLLSFYC